METKQPRGTGEDGGRMRESENEKRRSCARRTAQRTLATGDGKLFGVSQSRMGNVAEPGVFGPVYHTRSEDYYYGTLCWAMCTVLD